MCKIISPQALEIYSILKDCDRPKYIISEVKRILKNRERLARIQNERESLQNRYKILKARIDFYEQKQKNSD